jgi:sugar (pentulose or hexulose) kinase
MNGIVGTVTSAAAAELGIAEGTPVTTGTIDSITSAIGPGR